MCLTRRLFDFIERKCIFFPLQRGIGLWRSFNFENGFRIFFMFGRLTTKFRQELCCGPQDHTDNCRRQLEVVNIVHPSCCGCSRMEKANDESRFQLHFCLRAAQTWRTYKQRKHIDCWLKEAARVLLQMKARGGVQENISFVYVLLNAFFRKNNYYLARKIMFVCVKFIYKKGFKNPHKMNLLKYCRGSLRYSCFLLFSRRSIHLLLQ